MKDIGYFVISSKDIKNILALNRLLCLAPRTCVTMDQFSVGVGSLDNISLKSQGLTKPKSLRGQGSAHIIQSRFLSWSHVGWD